MEQRMQKVYSRSGAVALKVAQGHFATNHSHINYYIDITTLKPTNPSMSSARSTTPTASCSSATTSSPC